ncbi:FlgM family anti-sigma-28 factor [Streptohalobacillus salinus]|uniref:Negative regulator of flagellin synthesis n=1 Tax=Streptohalobacillus salinus TaxID=621096 RepID=A0A2V3WGN4_9BACI|nr:flagellar biosynthesis anti-sigma factor FlgM [Streptohalobacillus salinus]PXW93009.1 FlgM family anti-sigma-28 factor [Streptohalobacillus salinus]
MKIHGSHQVKVNPYQQQLKKQHEAKHDGKKINDQLQISDAAKKMQESDGVHPSREAKVNRIKQDVETGNYQVNPDQTAKSMLNFLRK